MRFQLNCGTSHPLPPYREGGGRSEYETILEKIETRFSFWYKMHFKHQDFSAVVELLQLTDQSCWAGRGVLFTTGLLPAERQNFYKNLKQSFFIKQSFSSLFKSPLSFVDFFKHWIFTFLNFVSNCKTASFTIFC